MQIWQNFKKNQLTKSLNKGLSLRSKRTVANSLSFATAKSIAFIFDAENPEFILGIQKYAEQLQKKGKIIFLLGLNINTKEIIELTLPCLNTKDIDWAGRPFGKLVDEWLNRPVDVVIHVSALNNKPIEYLTALTPAGLRIGPVTDQTSCYDLMLDIPADTTPQSFFKQMEILLGKIQVRNEPTIL